MDGVDKIMYNVGQCEHMAILHNRKEKEVEVSWEEYRQNMNFTNMVKIYKSIYRCNFKYTITYYYLFNFWTKNKPQWGTLKTGIHVACR